MKKLSVNFLLIGLTVLLFSGCSSTDLLEVGISMGPIHERWIKDGDYLKQYLEAKGAEVNIMNAEGDEMQQARQAKELIDNQIDVLIIVPVNSESAGKIVDYAKARGVKVIAYDRIVKDCDLDYYISFDNVRIGEIQADYLTRIKPSGKYAVLGGDPNDNNSVLLRLGQMNVMGPLITRGDIQIVLDKNVDNWDAEVAYQIVKDFLEEGNKLDAIIASNDALAGGAHKALHEFGMVNEVIISGQDAEIEACKRIVQGKQTMTVYKVVESLAYSTANIAMTLANAELLPNSQTTVFNGKMMVPAVLLSTMIPVAKENIRMTVIADGYLDENEVFEKD